MIDMYSLAMLVAGLLAGTIAGWYLARRASPRPKAVDEPAKPANGGYQILGSIGVPVLLLSSGNTVLFANRSAEAVFPVRTGASLFEGFRNPELLKAIEEVREIGVSQTVHYREAPPRERFFLVGIHPVEDGGGRDGARVALSFVDTTENVLIQRMRSDFIANASHELRTPLSTIRGFIETIRGHARKDEAATDRFLAIMQEQAERMSRLLDDLLSLSRLEMKGHVLPASTVSVNGLIGAVAEDLSDIADGYGVSIESTKLAGDLVVRGDEDELTSVLINLVENACKYGSSGGKVELYAETVDLPSGAGVRFSVRDYGPGIAEEHIPRLTERFYRVDVEESRKAKGTGLGLAIVKHILNRHESRLRVESVRGQGSTFSFTLPVSKSG